MHAFWMRYRPSLACLLMLLAGMAVAIPLVVSADPAETPQKIQEIFRTRPLPVSILLVGTFLGLGLAGLFFIDRIVARQFPKPLPFPARWGLAAPFVGMALLYGGEWAIGEAGIALFSGTPDEIDPEARPVLFQISVTVLAVGVVLAYARGLVEDRDAPWRALGIERDSARSLGTAPVLLILGMPLMLAMVCLASAVYVFLHRDIQAQAVAEVMAKAGPGTFVVLALFVVVVMPLVEELLFRGLLLGALAERLPDAWAIGVAALIFAVVHRDPAVMPPTFATGVILGAIRMRSGSIMLPWTVHGCSNLLMVLLTLFAPAGAGSGS